MQSIKSVIISLCLIVFSYLFATAENMDSSYIKFINKCIKKEGCFTFYQDSISGLTYMEIQKNQLDKDYLFSVRIDNAPLEVLLFQGSYIIDGMVIRFNKINTS